MTTSHTRAHRGPLGGYHSTTRTYVHDPDAPSRTRRFTAFTGISPWRPHRFAATVWVVVWLSIASRSEPAAWVLLAISAVAFGGWKLYQRRQAARRAALVARPPAPVPGPAWCDHCADWTIHPTEQHAA